MATRTASPVVYRAPAPRVQIVRVQSPRSAPMVKRGRSRGRGKGASGASMGAVMAGGLILGLAEKADLGLPQIPILGRKGTMALAAWAYARATGSKVARDIAIGMAAVSAYELGKEGSISGRLASPPPPPPPPERASTTMNEYVLGDDDHTIGDDDHTIGEDDIADIVGAVMARRRARIPQPRRALLALPPKPAWRKGEVAPGVYGPRDARELLPMTPLANNGIFDNANSNIRFVANPQKPFQPTRVIVSVRRSAGASGVIIKGAGLIVGTDPNLVEIADFDIEVFAGTNFGVGVKMRPAGPGIQIAIPCFASPNVAVGESVAVSISIIGQSIT